MGWNDHNDPYAITSDTGNHVCPVCVNDSVLAELVKSNAEECTCSYCGETTPEPSCAPIQTLLDHMVEAIYSGYTEVENELNLDLLKAGVGYDGDGLMYEIGFDPNEEELRQEVVDALGDRQWCERDYYGLSDTEAMQFGWKDFKKTIKHHRRFTFHTLVDPDPDDREVPPVGQMLQRITANLATVDVVRTITGTTPIWRVRSHKATEPLTVEEKFGPPPTEDATQSNRMSPAGIAMFYGSETFETAALETVNPEKAATSNITGVQFFPQKPMNILDLTALPFGPSFFDLSAGDRRATLGFLHGFVRDVSAPISRDGREHVDYAPTQAFTEFVRYEMVVDGKEIDGICYKSAKDGGKCYVIFCDHDQCLSTAPKWKGGSWLVADMTTIRSEPATKYSPPTPAPKGATAS